MNKDIKLKRYLVTVTFYPVTSNDVADVFYVWAYDTYHVKNLINTYYKKSISKLRYGVKIKKCWLSNIFYRLFNKVPNKPVCEHI